MILSGRLYDGRSTQVVMLQAQLTPGGIKFQDKEFLQDEFSLSPKLGRTARFIDFPDGSRLECEPQDALDELDRRLNTNNFISFIEGHWLAVLLSIFVALSFTWGSFTFGIPTLAKKVAMATPASWVQSSDEYTLAALDKSLFDASALSENRKAQLQQGFNILMEHSGIEASLEFRSSKQGANAFALPGGTVIMTDELVTLAKHDHEIQSVLAHELGHVQNRHGLRLSLQASAVTLVLIAVTGDLTGLDSILVNMPAVFMSMSYGRELEREADGVAFSIMQELGMSHEHFANIMERLHEGHSEAPEWFSTHPPSEERVSRFRNQ